MTITLLLKVALSAIGSFSLFGYLYLVSREHHWDRLKSFWNIGATVSMCTIIVSLSLTPWVRNDFTYHKETNMESSYRQTEELKKRYRDVLYKEGVINNLKYKRVSDSLNHVLMKKLK